MSSNVIEITQEVIGSIDVVQEVIGDVEVTSGGAQGIPGFSAYQTAVANGFVGTEEEWLVSLTGIILLDADEPLPPPSTPVGTLVYRRVS